mgnify:CR=1 FL=1
MMGKKGKVREREKDRNSEWKRQREEKKFFLSFTRDRKNVKSLVKTEIVKKEEKNVRRKGGMVVERREAGIKETGNGEKF